MINDSRPIGMMDSGVGGLTVLLAAQQALPQERFVYVGDTARMPYGSKIASDVVSFSQEIANFLINNYDIKLLVIACNTASACALPILAKELNIPIIGVIDGGARAAVQQSKNQKIGLIATQGTVNSGKYQAEIKQLNPDLTVIAQAEPEFVTLVESDQANNPAYQALIDQHLAIFVRQGVDTLVLGCTHFPLLGQMIQQAVGDQVTLIDPSFETANDIKKYLSQHKMLASQDLISEPNRYFTTGNCATFTQIASKWLQPTEPLVVAHLAIKHDAAQEYLEEVVCPD